MGEDQLYQLLTSQVNHSDQDFEPSNWLVLSKVYPQQYYHVQPKGGAALKRVSVCTFISERFFCAFHWDWWETSAMVLQLQVLRVYVGDNAGWILVKNRTNGNDEKRTQYSCLRWDRNR
jgi:hypothetical protein